MLCTCVISVLWLGTTVTNSLPRRRLPSPLSSRPAVPQGNLQIQSGTSLLLAPTSAVTYVRAVWQVSGTLTYGNNLGNIILQSTLNINNGGVVNLGSGATIDINSNVNNDGIMNLQNGCQVNGANNLMSIGAGVYKGPTSGSVITFNIQSG